jgi:hypothetical protein
MDAINITSFVILIYFSALQLVLYSLLIISFFDMRRRLAQNFYADYEAVAKSHFTFPISVLVPAYNESASVIESVRSVLSLDYPQHEVIVINDGSTDDTMARLTREFDLTRRIGSWRDDRTPLPERFRERTSRNAAFSARRASPSSGVMRPVYQPRQARLEWLRT